MIKALWFALKIGALIALAVWIADRPGSVRVEWMDYVFTIHFGFFLLVLLGAILLSIFVYQTLKTFIDFPKSLKRYNEIKGREKGYKALTLGLTAVAAGDAKTAAQQAKKATKLLPGDTGLPLLLEAQAARLDGREEDAAKSFTGLLEDKNAAFLGVRGLLQTALDSGDHEGALALAEQALALHPKQGWILKITYDMQIRLQRWRKAEKTLKALEKSKTMSAEQVKSDRVALLLAEAQADMHEDFKNDALQRVKKALKAAPDFAPASIMLSDIHAQMGHVKKARAVLEKAWKAAPHPALLSAWNALLDQDGAIDNLERLRKIERLIKLNTDSAFGHEEAGRIALTAGLWGEARQHLKRAEELGPTAGLYRLLAQLEENTTHDEEAIKTWLEKASEASAQKVWQCRETGRIYDTWSPVAQPHGSFNTIIWDVPSAGRPVIMLNEKADMAEALIEAPETDAAA